MQPRHTARELALLSMSQLATQPERLDNYAISDILKAVVKSLRDEAEELITSASTDLQRTQERLYTSDAYTSDPRQELKLTETAIKEALDLTRNAINRVGTALEMPTTLALAQNTEVRDYTIAILRTVHREGEVINETISKAMVDWQLSRLAQVDRDLLRIATAEMLFLKTPAQVAINEAVELAKRYSSEDGYRFINGVLRRIVESLPPGTTSPKMGKRPLG